MDKRNDPLFTLDDIVGIGMVWTLVGFIGMIFGLHIAWWDVLIALGLLPDGWLPANPRTSH